MCDFGLAVTRSAGAGTPAYMAPELLQGDAYTDKADVYAFGILFNELLARKPPFAGMEPERVSNVVMAGTRPDLATGVGSQLQDIVVSCWQTDASKRPCFGQVQERLSAAQASAS